MSASNSCVSGEGVRLCARVRLLSLPLHSHTSINVLPRPFRRSLFQLFREGKFLSRPGHSDLVPFPHPQIHRHSSNAPSTLTHPIPHPCMHTFKFQLSSPHILCLNGPAGIVSHRLTTSCHTVPAGHSSTKPVPSRHWQPPSPLLLSLHRSRPLPKLGDSAARAVADAAAPEQPGRADPRRGDAAAAAGAREPAGRSQGAREGALVKIGEVSR